MSKKAENPLLAATRALVDDLTRFEAISAELSRQPINSDKTLQRARNELLACSEHEAKLSESLRAFAAEIQGMQEAQQRCMDLTAAAAERIQARHEERAKLQERLALLAQNTRDVSGPVSSLPESPESLSQEMIAPLQEVERRLDVVIAEAAELCEIAKRDDWSDLERDTHTLQQHLQGVRNRVLICRRSLSKDAPS